MPPSRNTRSAQRARESRPWYQRFDEPLTAFLGIGSGGEGSGIVVYKRRGRKDHRQFATPWYKHPAVVFGGGVILGGVLVLITLSGQGSDQNTPLPAAADLGTGKGEGQAPEKDHYRDGGHLTTKPRQKLDYALGLEKRLCSEHGSGIFSSTNSAGVASCNLYTILGQEPPFTPEDLRSMVETAAAAGSYYEGGGGEDEEEEEVFWGAAAETIRYAADDIKSMQQSRLDELSEALGLQTGFEALQFKLEKVTAGVIESQWLLTLPGTISSNSVSSLPLQPPPPPPPSGGAMALEGEFDDEPVADEFESAVDGILSDYVALGRSLAEDNCDKGLAERRVWQDRKRAISVIGFLLRVSKVLTTPGILSAYHNEVGRRMWRESQGGGDF